MKFGLSFAFVAATGAVLMQGAITPSLALKLTRGPGDATKEQLEKMQASYQIGLQAQTSPTDASSSVTQQGTGSLLAAPVEVVDNVREQNENSVPSAAAANFRFPSSREIKIKTLWPKFNIPHGVKVILCRVIVAICIVGSIAALVCYFARLIPQ